MFRLSLASCRLVVDPVVCAMLAQAMQHEAMNLNMKKGEMTNRFSLLVVN